MKHLLPVIGINEIVCSLLENEKRGRLVDIGTGTGHLISQLKKAGFDAIACDLSFDLFKFRDIPLLQVDLNDPLPFTDNSVDYFTGIEVLEHLENRWLLFREIARILKPGGMVFFSTPNNEHIQARLYYLFTGQFPGFKKTDYDLTHINPVYINYLPVMLEKVGLYIKTITYNRGFIYSGTVSDLNQTTSKGWVIPIKNKSFGQTAIFQIVKK